MVSNQNLVKRKFPYIDIFDYEGHAVVNAIHDLTIRVFEHLDITSPMDVDKRGDYQLANDIAGDSCNLVKLKEIPTEKFCN